MLWFSSQRSHLVPKCLSLNHHWKHRSPVRKPRLIKDPELITISVSNMWGSHHCHSNIIIISEPLNCVEEQEKGVVESTESNDIITNDHHEDDIPDHDDRRTATSRAIRPACFSMTRQYLTNILHLVNMRERYTSPGWAWWTWSGPGWCTSACWSAWWPGGWWGLAVVSSPYTDQPTGRSHPSTDR